MPTSYIDNMKVAISPSNPAVAYFVIARPQIGKDTVNNTGEVRGIYTTSTLLSPSVSWTDITPTGANAKYMFKQGWYHNAVAVDPANPSTVFVGAGDLLKSTNQGFYR